MDARLLRIRELIDKKEEIDNELAGLLGGGVVVAKPKRGRPRLIEHQPGNGADHAPAEE
jgi:hypothetical protein